MTKTEIEKMMDETGIEYRYHHFETEEAINPPFMVWYMFDSSNTRADGAVYCKASRMNLELYTDAKDFGLEQQVEDVLDLYGVAYEKTEDYLDDEAMYEVLYEMEV